MAVIYTLDVPQPRRACRRQHQLLRPTGVSKARVARPATVLGTLTMLKLPCDEQVTPEHVYDVNHGRAKPGGVSHFVVQVDDVHATVRQMAARGVQAENPASPDGSAGLRTSWVIDPDGYRIELFQWPDGHPHGMTRQDLIDAGPSR